MTSASHWNVVACFMASVMAWLASWRAAGRRARFLRGTLGITTMHAGKNESMPRRLACDADYFRRVYVHLYISLQLCRTFALALSPPAYNLRACSLSLPPSFQTMKTIIHRHAHTRVCITSILQAYVPFPAMDLPRCSPGFQSTDRVLRRVCWSNPTQSCLTRLWRCSPEMPVHTSVPCRT